MKASLGLVFLGTAALAATSFAQSAQTGATASAASQTSATAHHSAKTQAKASATKSAATKASSKTGKVASSSPSPLKSGTTVQAELVQPIDARHSKVGDQVIATTIQDVTANGKVVVPSGSQLMGRIMGVRVQNSEQSTSQIGIAFNRAILKSGKQIPVALNIQAIGSSPEAAAATAAKARASRRAYGGGMLSGTSSSKGAVLNTSAHTRGKVVNTEDQDAAQHVSLTANSQGVFGLPGLSLFSQTTTFATASVVSSQSNDVHLDRGTEMVLVVSQK